MDSDKQDNDTGIDKQKVIGEILGTSQDITSQPETSTQPKPAIAEQSTMPPTEKTAQVPTPTKKKRSIFAIFKSRKTEESVPSQTILKVSLLDSIKEHRHEIAILFTVLVGLIWLLMFYATKEATPLTFAIIFIAPSIFYIFQLSKQKLQILPPPAEPTREAFDKGKNLEK